MNGWNAGNTSLPQNELPKNEIPESVEQNQGQDGQSDNANSKNSEPRASATQSSGQSSVDSADDTVLESNDMSFSRDVIGATTPVLVDFSAEWCGPCQEMVPVLEELARDYKGKLKIIRVDVDNNPQTRDKYRVASYPTFIFFNSGKAVGQYSGKMPKEVMSQLIDKFVSG